MPQTTQKTAPKSPPAQSGAPKLQPGGAATQLPALRPSGAVALPPELADELAQHAKDDAAKERPSVAKLSFRNATLTYLGNPVPGDKLDMILLATAFRNTYYDTPFDPDNIKNPRCFAINLDGEDMRPHENVKEPINETCDGCEFNKWGSDPRPASRGKACKEGRRVIAMPADAATDPDKVRRAELAIFDVPVTSVRNYGTFVNQINVTLKRPQWSVITEVSVHKHMRNQLEVKFTPMDVISDPKVIRAIKERLEDCQRIVTIPFDESSSTEEEPPTPAQQRAANKVRGKK